MAYSIPVQGDPDTYFSLRSAAQIETLRHGFAHENSRKIDHIMDVPGLAVPDTEAGQGTGSSGRSSWPWRPSLDRKSVGEGTGGAVTLGVGGRGIIKKKKKKN